MTNQIKTLLLSNLESNITLAFTLMQSQNIQYTNDLIELFELCEVDYNNIKAVKRFLLRDTLNIINTNVTTLPKIVSKTNFKNYFIQHNKLTSLENSPRHVNGYFNCRYNKLITLKGGPQSVNGFYDCAYNQLSNLQFSPLHIGDDFICNHNNLTTLEGSPQNVGRDFDCTHNNLLKIDFGPKLVNQHYFISNYNTTQFTEQDVRNVSEVKGKVYIF